MEIGDGIEASKSFGSENNDAFFLMEEKDYKSEKKEFDTEEQGSHSVSMAEASNSFTESLRKGSNHSGGILGGMSDGSTIRIRAGFKPTPSISKPQQTVNEAGEEITIAIKGRHDPTVVERANVVVEAMTALTVLDALLENLSARLDYVKKAYQR